MEKKTIALSIASLAAAATLAGAQPAGAAEECVAPCTIVIGPGPGPIGGVNPFLKISELMNKFGTEFHKLDTAFQKLGELFHKIG